MYIAVGRKPEITVNKNLIFRCSLNVYVRICTHKYCINFPFSASDSASKRGMNGAAGGSDIESDDGEEADYTVYECPGLAPVRT